MSTDTDLRARLRDLADDAPHAGLSGDELWTSGVRRQRLRRAATVAGAAVIVAAVVGLTSVLRFPSEPLPAQGPAELGIPRVVLPPDPWSEATAEPGPLAAISVANRRTTDGLTGVRDRLHLFGVSAVDGVSRFLDVPGVRVDTDPGTVALSPDGSQVAVQRGSRGRTVVGWDVLDTATGELTRLRVPGMAELANAWGYEIAFTGDGRYLRTSFSLTGSEESHADSFVAWDVATGERYVAEDSGHYWLPGRASGSQRRGVDARP